MAAITTTPTSTLTSPQPGFGSLLQSEWTKLRSLRSTWITVSLAIGLSIGFSALVALVTGLTYDSWSAGVQAEFDPVLTTISGWLFGLVFLIVFGATSVTSEYGSGMIRTTFIVTPDRTRVFLAKAVVVGLIGTAVSSVAIPGMFFISQPIFGMHDLPTASITDSGATRFLLASALLQGITYTILPQAFAWLLRSAAGAIAVSIAYTILPWMLAPMLPPWIQENVLRLMPASAEDSLIGLLSPGDALYSTQTPAIVIVTAWMILLPTAAVLSLRLRDV